MRNNKQYRDQYEEKDNRYQKSPDDLMPYPPQTQIHQSCFPRVNNIRNFMYRNLAHKKKLNKLQLQTIQSNAKINYLEQLNLNDTQNMFESSSPKVPSPNMPKAYNVKFMPYDSYPRQNKCLKLNSPTLKSSSKRNKDHSSPLFQSSHYYSIQKQKQYSLCHGNPEQQRPINNFFAPRISKIDYSKPNTEILMKYFERVSNNNTFNETIRKQYLMSKFTEIKHLQELQKLGGSHNVRHKPLHQIDKIPIKGMLHHPERKIIKEKKKRGQNYSLNPWNDRNDRKVSNDDIFNTIDVMEGSSRK